MQAQLHNETLCTEQHPHEQTRESKGCGCGDPVLHPLLKEAAERRAALDDLTDVVLMLKDIALELTSRDVETQH